MPKILTATAVAALLAAVPAGAATNDEVVSGDSCGFTSFTDLTTDRQHAELDGGPLVAGTPGATISMTCTIQVGAGNSVHAGEDAASASSSPTLQATALLPTFVSYEIGEAEPFYLCTQATVDGVTWYLDGVTRAWSPSAAVPCVDPVVPPESPPRVLRPVFDLVDLIFYDVVDPLVCGVTPHLPTVPGVLEVRPDGDVVLLGGDFWLCPPY